MKGYELIEIIKRLEAEDAEIKIGVEGYEIGDDAYLCYGMVDGVLWLTDDCVYEHEQ